MSDTVGRARALFGPLRWGGAGVTEPGDFVLPIGTVTLLLADIEASTHGWEERPEEMGAAIARLGDRVDAAVAGHEGVRPVEQGEGDSFVAAFSRASDAVRAAIEIQEGLAGEPVRLRIGIHTGEVQLRDDGNYVGPAINRTARLRDAAQGGQVVLSQAACELVAERLPPDAVLRDLGVHRLKDLGRPEHVFRLVHPSIPDDDRPLRSLDHVPNNLPVQLTSFVGREAELAELRRLVEETRLLTLTGAGGCGKTRLALELAAGVLDRFGDGVWFVDLSPVTDAKALPTAVAATLGIREQQGRRLLDTVADHLHTGDTLLVLDNCEHLVAAAADAAGQLLLTCPGLRVLATSRETLGLPGETAWRVPSLAVPSRDESGRLEVLSQCEAVRLFVERARQARPNFTVTNETAPAVAGICQRLDGVPLAIELAAARARVLSPDDILRGLDDRFRLLTGGARTSVARQQTLRASVDWSHQLLSGDEQRVLARLSVFAGGFTLDAAEAVAGAEPVGPLAVLDLLQDLVDKSLLVVDDGAHARYRMLETIRQYGAERLADSDEHDDIRRRHAAFFVALAEQAAPGLEGPEQARWVETLQPERQNIRAAFDWAQVTGDGETMLRLVASLFWFWVVVGRMGEGWRLARTAADARHGPPPAVVAAGLNGLATLAWLRGDASLVDLSHEAVEAARSCGDRRSEGRALYHTSWWGQYGDPEGGLAGMSESVGRARETGDQWGLAQALGALGSMLSAGGMASAATPHLEEGVAVCEALTERHIGAATRYNLARARQQQGRLAEAEAELLAVIEETRASGDTYSLTMSLSELGSLLTARGHVAAGVAVLRENVGLFDQGRLPWPIHEFQARGCLAEALLRDGQLDEALAEGQRAIDIARPLRPMVDGYLALTLAHGAVCEHLRGDGDRAGALLEEALEIAEGSIALREVGVANFAARLLAEWGEPDRAEQLAWHALDAVAGSDNGYSGMGSTVHVLDTLGRVVDDGQRAARLLGAADAHLDRAGIRRPWFDEAQRDAAVARLRTELGDAAYEQAAAEGAGLSLEDAVALARRGRGARRRPSSGWDSLTPTELEVARLVATGLSNPQVAARLLMSRKTVTTHLTHVFAKVGVTSRTELAAEMARRGMVNP